MCFPRKRTATQLVASTACPIPPPPFPVPRECVADALILLSVVSLKQTFPFLLSFPLLFVPSSSSSLLVEKETEASQTPRFPAATFQSHWCLCGRKRKRSRTPFLVLFFFFFLLRVCHSFYATVFYSSILDAEHRHRAFAAGAYPRYRHPYGKVRPLHLACPACHPVNHRDATVSALFARPVSHKSHRDR